MYTAQGWGKLERRFNRGGLARGPADLLTCWHAAPRTNWQLQYAEGVRMQ